MKKIASVLVACSVVFGVLQSSASKAEAEGAAASWTAGDFWEYTGLGTIMGNPFTMIMKIEVKDKASVTVNSTTHETWHCAVAISMTISGVPIPYEGDAYARVSDLADVKMTITSGAVTVTATYDPPNRDFDFPLSSGKTWSNTMTENMTISPGGTYLRTSTGDYGVSGPESVTVPAGTFSAYKIQRTEQAPPGNVSTIYYSDTVGYALKMGSPVPEISAELELKSYNYQAKALLGGMLWILNIVIVVVVAVAALLVVRRRRARAMASQPSEYQPAYGQPAQGQEPYRPPAQPPKPPQQR